VFVTLAVEQSLPAAVEIVELAFFLITDVPFLSITTGAPFCCTPRSVAPGGELFDFGPGFDRGPVVAADG
jgi:hypothetical protein